MSINIFFLFSLLLAAVVIFFYLHMYLRRKRVFLLENNVLQKENRREGRLSPGGTFGEITSKNENDEIIRELAFKVKLIIQAGNTGLWDFDTKKNEFCDNKSNNSYYKGYALDQFLQMVHPDDRHIPLEMLRMLKNDEVESIERQCRMRLIEDGEYRYLNLVAVVSVRDENGKPLVITGLRWDVTHEMEEKQRLLHSKTLLDLTFAAVGAVPWLMDFETGKMISSHENSVLYGKDMTVDQYIDQVVFPEHKELVRGQVRKICSREVDSIDVRFRAFDNGKYEWKRIMGRTILDPRTNTYVATGTSCIITEEVEKQEELVMLRKKAEESNRLKTAFLANMSHEIRTPLNAIVGFSNLITQAENPEEAQEYARLIETNNELLLQLVSDILDISKIEAGQMDFTFANVDICEIFNDLKQVYSVRMPAGVEFICNLPGPSCMLFTEKNRFIQVLSNFLSNAVKYTARGNITMGYEHAGNDIRLYVRDTGKGIAREHQPKLFERFSKFDAHVAGTGLGLSICETIVSKLGGQIGVESELGKGSEFWFTVPDVKM
ncbi:MAG: ATP-binding protein [Bacteroidales bacterium]|nr:ATP-binding protein [Bacteroidales bacterium]